jgi:exopolysaccharide biosynthesis polyprenyl glycosylphosphotransferase
MRATKADMETPLTGRLAPARTTGDPVAVQPNLLAGADERTLAILEHRRQTGGRRRRGWLVRRALLLADVVGLTVAFLVAQTVAGSQSDAGGAFGRETETLLFLATLPAWIVLAKLYGLYDRDEERTDHTTVDDLSGVFHLVTVGAWLSFFGSWLTSVAEPDLFKLGLFWALAIALIVLSRTAARAYCRRTVNYLQNAVIVGADDVGQLAARKILRHPEYGINVVGFVDSSPQELHPDVSHLSVLGRPERLLEIVRLLDVERVVIGFSGDSSEQTLDLVRSLKDVDVQVDVVPRLFELVSSNAGIHTIEGMPLVSLPPLRLSPSSRLLKRTMDATVSFFGLALLSPVFLLIALTLKLGSRGPVFFRQVRMGARDHTFTIVKFRTMVPGADERRAEVAHLNVHGENGAMLKVKNDPRVTRVGRLLRRTSLDELPQLWNVLKGEMSLVGPRPLPLDEDRHVGSWARRRLDLRPGMTGPWQVLGRSDIPFEEMVKLDYLYVTGWSLGYDLKLLARTIPGLFSVRGAY